MLFSGNFGPRAVLPNSSPAPVLVSGGGPISIVQPLSLRAYWPFTFGNYLWWGSEANSIHTETAQGDNEIPQGNGNLPAVTGFFDSGVQFDGNTGYLQGQNSDASPTGSADRSFCCWVQVPNFSAVCRIFMYGTRASAEWLQFCVLPNPRTPEPPQTLELQLGAANQDAWGAIPLAANVPFHVGFSVSSTLATTKLYVNGVLDSTTTDGSATLNTFASQKFMFGRPQDLSLTSNPAIVWSARLYSRILSAADFADIYAAELANKWGPYSPFNEMPALKGPALSTVFRRTLSGLGTRVGSRQIQGYMNG